MPFAGRRQRAEHLHRQRLVGEEVEGVGVARLEVAEGDRAAAVAPHLQRLLPGPEVGVHRGVGHGEQVVGELGDEHLVADRDRLAERGQLRDGRGPLDQAVVKDALGVDEEPLVGLRGAQLLRGLDLREPGEMVRVAVAHHHRVDLLRRVRGGAAEAPGEVAGEELVVAAVDRDHLAGRRLDHGGVALLDVHEVDLHHRHGLGRRGCLDRPLPGHGHLALHVAVAVLRLDAAVGLGDVVGGAHLHPGRGLLEHVDRVTPGEHRPEAAVLAHERRQVHVDRPSLGHLPSSSKAARLDDHPTGVENSPPGRDNQPACASCW